MPGTDLDVAAPPDRSLMWHAAIREGDWTSPARPGARLTAKRGAASCP